MKYLLLSLATLSVASPAFAHVQTVPHVHGNDYGLWAGVTCIGAAVIVGLLSRNKRNLEIRARHDRRTP